MPRLCVDIDNVIAHTDAVLRAVINRHTAGRVRLNYDDVQEFKYQECRDANGNCIDDAEWEAIHDEFSTPAILSSILPDAGAVAALRKLNSAFEVIVVTSRKPQGEAATVEWLSKHNVIHDDFRIVPHGQKHVATSPFFAAVEDDYKQAAAFAQIGTPCLLIKHPWNANKEPRKLIEWVENWAGASAILETRLANAK